MVATLPTSYTEPVSAASARLLDNPAICFINSGDSPFNGSTTVDMQASDGGPLRPRAILNTRYTHS